MSEIEDFLAPSEEPTSSLRLALLAVSPPSSHRCDDRCLCERCEAPLLWWPLGRQHACSDPECARK